MADSWCSSNKGEQHESHVKSTCCGTKEEQQLVIAKTSCCSGDAEVERMPEAGKSQGCCSGNEEVVSMPEAGDSKSCSSQTAVETRDAAAQSCCSSETDSPKGEEAEYRIHGMDCPSCALSIEKGLSKLENIAEAKVNYNSAKLKVTGSDFEQVESEVQKLGFKIEPLKQNKNMRVYSVEGMDCGSCAKSIENHLNTIPAVNHVSVNFSTGKMKVEHENSVEEIVTEVSKIGFKASLLSKQKPSTEETQKEGYGGIITSGILIALGFAGSFTGISTLITTFLYASAMVISGYKPVKSAYYSIKSRSLDMNVLMSAAAIGAALIGEWLEGATVVWLFALGTALQTMSIEKTRNSIRNLMNLAPSEAWIIVGSQLTKRHVEEVAVGDILVVKPGDRIPLDGEILKGESSINQAPITGESIPVDKEAGDTVYAGTINENGSLEIRVTKLAEDTTIAKIIHLVEEAQEQKAPTQAFIDKFAAVYTPIVFVLALVVMVLPPLIGFGTWGEWFYKGLELLVVACPCALVISTPVAIVSAIGNAARNGVLIKGGTFLEKAGAITAIAFDKTGTLTEGKPKVSEIKAFNVSEEEVLSIARTLEEYSTHPIARTVVGFAKEKGIEPKDGELFKSIVGKGVQAEIDGAVHYAGNARLFEEKNLPLGEAETVVQALQSKGMTVVIIGTKQKVLGVISVADSIRTTTVHALDGLKKVGIGQVVMLTGDNEGTARMISKEASVSRYFADLLPEDKVDAIKKLQSEGHKVAMVGDGINDAPALATADLGIAMGGAGTDTAMETADVVLMADNLEKLPYTINLSRKALKIIKQNIWFSLIVKFAALALIFPGWLTLWLAVLSDTGAAIIVILNALRLLKVNR
ncbi:heavy metal translocating P-type ATPase [Bacillus sp. Marseille-Q1617]|uniref:heavy metal translocating P-type ATPase n=1 Tax=Bacillus sp. Marseille-Q1617 TaxID=2736887 RepID=UPI00158B763C|nr:heavy metal translocating P-type ATPase [Bacillus sp. Marseille-Q1617]